MGGGLVVLVVVVVVGGWEGLPSRIAPTPASVWGGSAGSPALQDGAMLLDCPRPPPDPGPSSGTNACRQARGGAEPGLLGADGGRAVHRPGQGAAEEPAYVTRRMAGASKATATLLAGGTYKADGDAAKASAERLLPCGISNSCSTEACEAASRRRQSALRGCRHASAQAAFPRLTAAASVVAEPVDLQRQRAERGSGGWQRRSRGCGAAQSRPSDSVEPVAAKAAATTTAVGRGSFQCIERPSAPEVWSLNSPLKSNP